MYVKIDRDKRRVKGDGKYNKNRVNMLELCYISFLLFLIN